MGEQFWASVQNGTTGNRNRDAGNQRSLIKVASNTTTINDASPTQPKQNSGETAITTPKTVASPTTTGNAPANNTPRLGDGRIDMTNQYNTQLTPDEEAKFQSWVKANGRENDFVDYDMRGAWKAGAGQAANGHFPDTYKKPNHPTFSDQSQYNGKDGYVGGKWTGDDTSATFTPSESNLKNMPPADLQKYFNEREPNSKLMLEEKTSATQPVTTPPVDAASKSIFNDMSNIGVDFYPAFNFYSSLFN